MDGLVAAADLCRSSVLTESSLLANLESRYKDDLTESYVGNVLLRMSHSSLSSSQYLPLFCSSVVQSLMASSHNQFVVVYGRQSKGKGQLFADALADVLLHLDDPYDHVADITNAVKILQCLCHSVNTDQSTCVTMVTLLVDQATSTLRGAHLSVSLLDTSQLVHMQVFHEAGGIRHVTELLLKLGMSGDRSKEVQLLLETVLALTAGKPVAAILKRLKVQLPRNYTITANKLSQLLYAYLVHWLVLWVNSVCGSDGCLPVASISLLSSPGLCGNEHTRRRQLPSLLMAYADQFLLNIYCSRQFVWEQEQYLEEGVEWEEIEVDSNDALVDTFHRDGGLMDALSCSSYESMKGRVQEVCLCSGDSCFMSGNMKMLSTVHLTGECEYDLGEAWLQDNDIHRADDILKEAFTTSSCDLLVGMAKNMCHSPDHIVTAEPIGRSLLTHRAKASMETLCDIITSCNPHFLFSVEPTAEPSSDDFHGEVVLNQLQELKVLDTALMQSCGYPVRMSHEKFFVNYHVLLSPQATARCATLTEKCKMILQEADLKDCHVGTNSVMLKPWHLSEMDNAADLYHRSARRLQHAMRRSLLRRKARISSPSLSEATVSNGDEAKQDVKTTPSAPPPAPPPRPTLSSKASSMSEVGRPFSSLPCPLEVTKPHPSPPPSPHPPAPAQCHPTPSNSTFSALKKKNSWKSSTRRKHSPSRKKESELSSQVWFLGAVSREKAEECLKTQPAGTFMVRESQKRVGEYSLSVSHGNTVKHFRVDTKGDSQQRFQLYGAQRSFSSVAALVDHYSQLCISPRGELLLHPYTAVPEAQVKPFKRNLGSIHRSKPEPSGGGGKVGRGGRGSNSKHKSKSCDLSVGVDSVEALKKQLQVEERIVEAARRMAELPTGTKRERQKRKQSLQMAQSKLLSLRQEYHLTKQRNLFIEYSMHPVLDEDAILQ